MVGKSHNLMTRGNTTAILFPRGPWGSLQEPPQAIPQGGVWWVLGSGSGGSCLELGWCPGGHSGGLRGDLRGGSLVGFRGPSIREGPGWINAFSGDGRQATGVSIYPSWPFPGGSPYKMCKIVPEGRAGHCEAGQGGDHFGSSGLLWGVRVWLVLFRVCSALVRMC